MKTDISSYSILELQVLWLLSIKEAHGYTLIKELSRKRNKKLTAGTLYPILQKFKRNGLIRLKSKTGKRKKKVYEITPAGKKALNAACTEFCLMFKDIFNRFYCGKCATK